MSSYIWLAVSVAAVCHVQTSVESAPITTASEDPSPPSQADRTSRSMASRRTGLGKSAPAPTCSLDPKATIALYFLTDDVRKLVLSSDSRLAVMNTLLNEVLALLEKDEGKPSLEDVEAGLRAKLSAFVSEQVSALQRVQGELRQRVERLESEKAALDTQVTDLRRLISAKRCESGVLTFEPHGKPSVHQSDRHSMRTKRITSHKPFAAPPKVTARRTSPDAKVMVDISISNRRKFGFDLSVYDSADTYTYSVDVS